MPQIEVTFEIDANGILQVAAEDKGTGKAEKITITAEKGRLSEEDIERMVREAEEYADEDKKVKERIDARNGLESSLYNMKHTLDDDEKELIREVTRQRDKMQTTVEQLASELQRSKDKARSHAASLSQEAQRAHDQLNEQRRTNRELSVKLDETAKTMDIEEFHDFVIDVGLETSLQTKKSVPPALYTREVEEKLGLNGRKFFGRPWHVQACCAPNGDGRAPSDDCWL